MNKRAILIVYRYFFGLLTLMALVAQAAYMGQLSVLNTVNFLSYFTNLSNLFVSAVFIFSAFYLINRREPSRMDDIVRGASVLYMLVTGVVYATLLSGEDLGLLLPWVNVQLHFIMPLAVLADWLIQPQRSKLTVKQTAWWLVFPVVFLAYTLVRGSFVDWYPYPFLNPVETGGYGGVAIYCLAILAVFAVLGWLLMLAGNKLKRNVT
jgi:hypothetical protein